MYVRPSGVVVLVSPLGGVISLRGILCFYSNNIGRFLPLNYARTPVRLGYCYINSMKVGRVRAALAACARNLVLVCHTLVNAVVNCLCYCRLALSIELMLMRYQKQRTAASYIYVS